MNQLSNIQQELLNIYSSNIEEQDLLHIKKYLPEYFGGKGLQDADVWQDTSYNLETIKQWLNEESLRFEI